MGNKYNFKTDAVDLFDDWAAIGKDKGFEKNHSRPVHSMLEHIDDHFNNKQNLSFLDLGCGNGWVVREILKDSKFNKARGIDGSQEMINNALSIDPKGDYECSYIENLNDKSIYDIIFSMEFMYYLSDPVSPISNLVSNNLSKSGMFIMGIDYHLENKKSHGWPDSLGIYMNLKSLDGWQKILKDANLSDIDYWTIGETLVVYGFKK